MPETRFNVQWPDGAKESCYSPSSVIHEFFQINHAYSVSEFEQVAERALSAASERVRAKYGYACSSAMDQLGTIKRRCQHFQQQDDLESDSVIVCDIN